MKDKTMYAMTAKDVAILVFLLCIFSLVFIVAVSPASREMMYISLSAIILVSVMIGFFGRTMLSIALSGTLCCLWMGYRLYTYYVLGEPLLLTDYAFIPLPLIASVSTMMFQSSSRNIETENLMLRRQVEELVMIDDLTGLYNLRAMYRDLNVMVNYCSRNGLPVTLMIIQLRYEQELRGMMSANRFTEFCQRYSDLVRVTVRVEDRAYCIDSNCTIALITTTNTAGCEIIKNRIIATISKKDSFKGILDDMISVDLRFAAKEYDKSYGNNMMEFKQSVESELVYDV